MANAHAIASRAAPNVASTPSPQQLAFDGRTAVRADRVAQRLVQLARLVAERRVAQALR
jgi:hypothetical protein